MIEKLKKECQANKFGFYFFQFGIVLLASAFSISTIFFLISIIFGIYIYLREKKFELIDLPIIICFFLMPLICFAQNLSPYLNSLLQTSSSCCSISSVKYFVGSLLIVLPKVLEPSCNSILVETCLNMLCFKAKSSRP